MGRDGAEGARGWSKPAVGHGPGRGQLGRLGYAARRAEAGLACAIFRPTSWRARSQPGRGGSVQVSDSSSRILAGLLEARTGQQLTMSRRWRIETALAPCCANAASRRSTS
jgi:hypothetical protein